jgi:hypothetical protein
MATNTYVALDKVTVETAVSSITFTDISQAYTDLVIVTNFAMSANNQYAHYVQVNGDTGNNYSRTILYGDGSDDGSAKQSNNPSMYFGTWNTDMDTTDRAVTTIFFNSYSNTTTYKTAMGRWNVASKEVGAGVGLWRSADAITSINLSANSTTYIVGSTFSLYGIKAESVSPTPKATGGTIYSDSTYYYHAFGSSGTFTPLSSLTADILVVGGGGGGGYDNGGGGGAGGIALYSSQSLTATGYSCTVGPGGGGSSSSASKGSTGGTSTFAGLTAKVGGGGGGSNTSLAGATGASSGGGSGEASSGASGSATDGFAGAASNGTFTSNGTYNSGGGGGSAAAATQPGTATATGGSGGLGVSTYSTWLSATGLGKDGLIAGGGGGATLFNASTGSATGGVGSGGGGNGGAGNTATNFSNGTNGLYASGSGGGGGSRNIAGTFASGNGGSGVIIIRYLKE